MKFSEFLTTDDGKSFVGMITNDYPTFYKHMLYRFSNQKILYPEDLMLKYLADFLINQSIKLKQIEVLSTLSFNIDDLGTTTTTKTTSNATGQNSNTLSYTGYNVKGDYTKNKSKVKQGAENNGTQNTLNKFLETAAIANVEIKKLFDELDNELWNLFIQLH